MYVVLVLCNTRSNDVIRSVNGSVDVDLKSIMSVEDGIAWCNCLLHFEVQQPTRGTCI